MQALVILVMFLLSTGVAYLFKIGGMDLETRLPWTLTIAFLLLFMVYNVIIGLLSDHITRYWFYSLFAFCGLMMLCSFLASLISGMSMDEAGTYRWIYFIFCPIYGLFIVMITMIKKIVKMAQREDHRFDNKDAND